MGRQFMVNFINFTVNLCGVPLSGAEVFNFPSWWENIFLGSGIAMVWTVVTVGQLTSQVRNVLFGILISRVASSTLFFSPTLFCNSIGQRFPLHA